MKSEDSLPCPFRAEFGARACLGFIPANNDECIEKILPENPRAYGFSSGITSASSAFVLLQTLISVGFKIRSPFSSLKRLMTGGYVIKTDRYELDDPFFSRWIKERRER